MITAKERLLNQEILIMKNIFIYEFNFISYNIYYCQTIQEYIINFLKVFSPLPYKQEQRNNFKNLFEFSINDQINCYI